MASQSNDGDNVSDHIVKVPLHMHLPRVTEEGTTRRLYVEITIKRVGGNRTWAHAEWDEIDLIDDPLQTVPPGITIFTPKDHLALPTFIAVPQINDLILRHTFLLIVRITEWLPGVVDSLELHMSAVRAYTTSPSQSTAYAVYHDNYEDAETLLQLLGLTVTAEHSSTTSITQSDM
ncbi:hypothetical protein VTO73DRAFT_7948 [Trametes versicolor]